MRRIETEGGTIIGKVDRVTRSVIWSLECPGCTEHLPLTVETFKGERAILCAACGWKSEQISSGEDGRAYYDYTADLEGRPAREPDQLVRSEADRPTRGMRF